MIGCFFWLGFWEPALSARFEQSISIHACTSSRKHIVSTRRKTDPVDLHKHSHRVNPAANVAPSYWVTAPRTDDQTGDLAAGDPGHCSIKHSRTVFRQSTLVINGITLDVHLASFGKDRAGERIICGGGWRSPPSPPAPPPEKPRRITSAIHRKSELPV